MCRTIIAVLFIAVTLGASVPVVAQVPGLTLIFEPATATDTGASAEYRAIWAADGGRITEAMARRTGLPWREDTVRVVVVEEASSSGYGARPMRLRSSYATDTKRATLIHELGHRLQNHLFLQADEDHPYLFLYLYDVWVELYGAAFADTQVAIESRRRGYFDYAGAWQAALAGSPAGRLAEWRAFLASR